MNKEKLRVSNWPFVNEGCDRGFAVVFIKSPSCRTIHIAGKVLDQVC